MTPANLIVDASIAVKWFRPREIEPERELAEILIAEASIRITSLCLYEVGNVLATKTRDSDEQIGRKLEALVHYCGPPLELTVPDFRLAGNLARRHKLTFYDASYVAIAERLGRKVVSADQDLIGPGLAVDLATAVGAG
ncbi:MAG TPA: type II toxin-antitoxin system VapC family toxin [Solirubrobacterales bacterium]|jgi:predicted nucleic acid-binding protein|nr:type II toxin-antitoxin system VapC family toxin [Solirubrobacterales bacterium]HMU25852.1 type II toxin-antitoxin system VapC family toxin [Solirubrobacterales bacterium]HMW45076.1 type II toxin-antitoxin system VapC family toxin [Solirubrobacterales bacterium]HMX70243.1 type II toxin-antitoxin system VapC family toxin [Solirubrobacterales bacterium]HMY24794.1 type II toxin-antitoxin system VapC family toxin [Solirubrobacterales bacterium]